MPLIDLEQHVAHDLRRLPTPGVPPTLLPRVLTAVHAWAARPWYQRAWFTWPVGLQAASLVTLVLLVGSSAVLIPEGLTAAGALFTPALGALAGGLHDYERVLTASQAVWSALIQPLLLYASPLVALMCLVCGTVAAALNRVASGRALQS